MKVEYQGLLIVKFDRQDLDLDNLTEQLERAIRTLPGVTRVDLLEQTILTDSPHPR